jgi:hypothetical protein
MDASADAEFSEFMHGRWSGLVRLGYGLTGDLQLAEDLAQTAFARACASWSRVRRADHPDACLRRIVINANRSRFRKLRVTEVLTESLPEQLSHAGTGEEDADRAALMAFVLPPGVNILRAVACQHGRELGYSVPFRGAGLCTWRDPGQAGPARQTRVVTSSRLGGQQWQSTAQIGPWGYCRAVSPAGAAQVLRRQHGPAVHCRRSRDAAGRLPDPGQADRIQRCRVRRKRPGHRHHAWH